MSEKQVDKGTVDSKDV